MENHFVLLVAFGFLNTRPGQNSSAEWHADKFGKGSFELPLPVGSISISNPAQTQVSEEFLGSPFVVVISGKD